MLRILPSDMVKLRYLWKAGRKRCPFHSTPKQVGLAALNMTDLCCPKRSWRHLRKTPSSSWDQYWEWFCLRWNGYMKSAWRVRWTIVYLVRSEVGRVKPSVYFIQSRSPFAAPGLIDAITRRRETDLGGHEWCSYNDEIWKGWNCNSRGAQSFRSYTFVLWLVW